MPRPSGLLRNWGFSYARGALASMGLSFCDMSESYVYRLIQPNTKITGDQRPTRRIQTGQPADAASSPRVGSALEDSAVAKIAATRQADIECRNCRTSSPTSALLSRAS